MQEGVSPVFSSLLRQRQRFINARQGAFFFALSFHFDRSEEA